ncbi:MAG: hypothetical protein H6975_07370 [Gammaproteobacteria bacterium]|nr:hypothetical protein [Gammaproteobacteria bacterium]
MLESAMQLPGLKMVTLPPSTGYGDAAYEYIAGFDALGIPVTWTPTFFDSQAHEHKATFENKLHGAVREQVMRLWRRPIDYTVLLLNLPPLHGYADWLYEKPRVHLFAYVAWELERLPETWSPVLNQFECVFVPSEFNRRAFLASTIERPIYTVPHIARRMEPMANENEASWNGIDDDDFVFYTIGSWTTRKAMEETVRCYLSTFVAGEKVALIIKTDRVNAIELMAMSDEMRKRAPAHFATVWWTLARIIADYPKPAKILLMTDRLSSRKIDQLHARGDCFVSLTHSEGWGLGAFDALLFGNPVIMTGWGGQIDYLGADYPLAVRYTLEATAKAPRDPHYLGLEDALWAYADNHHAGQLMRSVFEDRKVAQALGREMQMRLRQRFAPPLVCRRFAELMRLEQEP